MQERLRCPDCNKKIKWKDLKKDRCGRCGFKITMEFILGCSIEEFMGWEWKIDGT